MTAFTFRAVGTVATNTDSSALSPGAPAGKAVGDLLILVTGNRASSQTITTPTGWFLAGGPSSNGSIRVYVRIADGSADDTPSPDWSGTAASYAYIVAYSGGGYPGDIRTIVVKQNGEGNNAQHPGAALCSILRDNCMLFSATQKNKTATSNDATTLTVPATGGMTRRTQTVMAGTALSFACADVQQTTATDFDGTDWTINGTSEATLGTVAHTMFIRTDATASTIIYDTITEHTRTDTTSPQTFSHAGAASGVKGAVLSIIHGASSTDHVSAASYGGTAMTRAKRNTDSTTEPGAAELWFLGASVPQGTQTVSYTCGATTDDIYAACITLVSDGDLEVIDTDGIDNNTADPSVTLQASGREIYCIGSLYDGTAAPSDFTENRGSDVKGSSDLGAFWGLVLTQDISVAADFTLGGTVVTDDVAYAAAAIAKVVVASEHAARKLPLLGVA